MGLAGSRPLVMGAGCEAGAARAISHGGSPRHFPRPIERGTGGSVAETRGRGSDRGPRLGPAGSRHSVAKAVRCAGAGTMTRARATTAPPRQIPRPIGRVLVGVMAVGLRGRPVGAGVLEFYRHSTSAAWHSLLWFDCVRAVPTQRAVLSGRISAHRGGVEDS